MSSNNGYCIYNYATTKSKLNTSFPWVMLLMRSTPGYRASDHSPGARRGVPSSLRRDKVKANVLTRVRHAHLDRARGHRHQVREWQACDCELSQLHYSVRW